MMPGTLGQMVLLDLRAVPRSMLTYTIVGIIGALGITAAEVLTKPMPPPATVTAPAPKVTSPEPTPSPNPTQPPIARQQQLAPIAVDPYVTPLPSPVAACDTAAGNALLA